MKRWLDRLPMLLTLAASLTLLAYGPIAQFQNYHDFADQRAWIGLPFAADVLSNAGFALVGLWALWRLWPSRRHPELVAAWPAYMVFFAALTLTALGSGYYHLAPDNVRLVWDRLPIALACAGLLAAVRAEVKPSTDLRLWLGGLGLFAVASVVWWYGTELRGAGDLRPYLLIQGLPMLLIPLWLVIYRRPRADRMAFGAALFCYALAKAAELYDHDVLEALGVLSGHTLKHLLATLAAAILALRLAHRVGRAVPRGFRLSLA